MKIGDKVRSGINDLRMFPQIVGKVVLMGPATEEEAQAFNCSYPLEEDTILVEHLLSGTHFYLTKEECTIL